MNLRRGSVRSTTPISAKGECTPSAPIKSLTLASGATSDERGSGSRSGSRILAEIRQHFRWLSRRSKRNKPNRPPFSASELRQTNSVLTALLHNNGHQHVNMMVNTYLNSARERFERSRLPTASSAPTPKTRISRSLSSSSVLLTCLNSHCNKVRTNSNKIARVYSKFYGF